MRMPEITTAFISGSTGTFAWTPGWWVMGYRLTIGTTRGATDVYDETIPSARAAPSRGCPRMDSCCTGVSMRGSISWDGNISISIHPRQWHASAANDNFADGGHATSGWTIATLTQATFQWTAAANVDSYRLSVGTIPGGTDIYDAAQGALQRDRYKPATTGIRSGSACLAFLRYGHVGVSRSAILAP